MSVPVQIKWGSEGPKPSKKSLWISIALGVTAALANLALVSQSEGSRLTVLKAKNRIVAGSVVNEQQFERIQISGPLNDLKKLVVQADALSSFKSIPLASTLEAGELLFQSSLNATASQRLRDSIPDDYRAITLSVRDEAAAMGYQLAVGNLIDVCGLAGNPIINSVKIVAIGGATLVPGTSAEYRSVSVVVPAPQVSSIYALLQQSGDKVRISLIGPSGH